MFDAKRTGSASYSEAAGKVNVESFWRASGDWKNHSIERLEMAALLDDVENVVIPTVLAHEPGERGARGSGLHVRHARVVNAGNVERVAAAHEARAEAQPVVAHERVAEKAQRAAHAPRIVQHDELALRGR